MRRRRPCDRLPVEDARHRYGAVVLAARAPAFRMTPGTLLIFLVMGLRGLGEEGLDRQAQPGHRTRFVALGRAAADAPDENDRDACPRHASDVTARARR